jgi:GNAT superfamily N-acetyltransferase
MNQNVIRHLGDGLVLRRATAHDSEELAAFHGDVHRDPGATGPDEGVVAWTRDLLEREHPTFRAGDFLAVEDTRTGAIVSSLCLISQTWTYEGVEFGVGRPELVGTHPDYRRRGLVRALFEQVHLQSAERGEMMQAITGIPWYYRQFGYEMALALDAARFSYAPQAPKLEEGAQEPYRVRPATEDDLPFMANVYEVAAQRSLVACTRDEVEWRYELCGKSKRNVCRRDLRVIEAAGGERVGFLALSIRLWRGMLGAWVYELKPGVSWLAVTPSVVRYLWALGETWAARDPAQQMEMLAFRLGDEHPIYRVYRHLAADKRRTYAWSVRVPDLAAFIRQVAPVLERRLAESPLVGYGGELTISFYRSGLKLTFERGRLAHVESSQPTPGVRASARFPDLTFLQLLLGYRSLEELEYAFADCLAASDEARALLEILFPKRPSDIWPVS